MHTRVKNIYSAYWQYYIPDRVMDLQDMSVALRKNSSLKQSKINDFFNVIRYTHMNINK